MIFIFKIEIIRCSGSFLPPFAGGKTRFFTFSPQICLERHICSFFWSK
nr:MAG TPA: hypothetical protein [Caudoviricetes sp.]